MLNIDLSHLTCIFVSQTNLFISLILFYVPNWIFKKFKGPDEWPTQKHDPIAAHSLRLGQFALLVKKDGSLPTDNNSDEHDSSNATIVASATTSETLSSFKSISIVKKESDQITTTSNVDNVEITQQNLSTPNNNKNKHSKKQSKKSWPCTENDMWCPPSCSITNYNKGTIHSCSDKLCRWNCLGLQGSLLMPMLEAPLYMATLTVGRKFSRAICQRAVCCRAEGFWSRIGGTNVKELDENESSVETHREFRLNHPALMETCVYMDESGNTII